MKKIEKKVEEVAVVEKPAKKLTLKEKIAIKKEAASKVKGGKKVTNFLSDEETSSDDENK